MRRILGFLFVACVGATVVPITASSEPAALDVLVTLDRPASAALTARFARLGSWAWAARHIPVAAVRIPAARLDRLRSVDGVRAVHPNRRLTFFGDEGSPAPALPGLAPEAGFGAAVPVPELGVTGNGVTVAIVDTGVDFTHPDLGPALRANVKFDSLGRFGPTPPVEGLPNTDTTSGHGTHIAGDVAGRGVASGGAYQGAAPGASLVGLGVGEGLNVSSLAVVQAYDWILEHRQRDGIRIVNNSYGTATFMPFDPDDPINQATKAAADAGLVVVFAQGNNSDELTMNSHGAAPWVIPVAAGTRAGGVTGFSSGGIDADVIGDCSTCTITGETRRPLQMGRYHPAVVAIGENVVGPRAAATIVPLYGARHDVALPPGQQARYTIQSGTSVASPETAGVVALLLEANPALRPADVRQILQVTARTIPGVPFFRQGYGNVDVAAAVGLARQLAGHPADAVRRMLDERQAARDAAILDGLAHPLETVAWSDYIPAFGGGVAHQIQVAAGTARLKAVSGGFDVPFPPTPVHTIVVRDAAGKEVARSAPRSPRGSPATVLDLDLTGRTDVTWGTWTVSVSESSPLLDDVYNSEQVTLVATFAEPRR